MMDLYMQEHLHKARLPTDADGYGLIAYTYNDGVPAEGYYSPGGMNIGDYVQSLAARQFLPSVDAYVDRDQLGCHKGVPIKMIMNAWYSFWRKNRVFAPTIRPLMVAVHINNGECLEADTLRYFKQHEPIGCRDYNTARVLSAHGIKAYFSGCMTLTLGQTYRVSSSDRLRRVLFMDYWLGKNRKIDYELLRILRRYPDCERVSLTNLYPLSRDIEGCLQEAEDLVKAFASSTLVITENIHCALPCLAVGTPVILAVPEYDQKRFEGLWDFFNVVGEQADGSFGCRIRTDRQNLVVNPSAHEFYAEYLTLICRAFMGASSFKGLNGPAYSAHQEFNHQGYDRRRCFVRAADRIRSLLR